MSDPVLALVLLAVFAAAIGVARFFKTLETGFWRAARIPVFAGLTAGLLIRVAGTGPLHFAVAGIVLTFAALYVRLIGEESEPVDGMLLGAVTGAAAAVPLLFRGHDDVAPASAGELLALAECLLAGAVAGYGITFGLFHVRDRMRQVAIDSVTAVAAALAAWTPALLHQAGISQRHIAIAVTAIIPMIGIATVFGQWSDVRAELSHEASLGFIADSDVRRTAHPLLRFGRGGWSDARAHREFVRLANKVALRKRQQRNRSEDVARLYQLEIIKLRMQIQEVTSINRATRSHGQSARGPGVRSDTMPGRHEA